MRVCQFRHLGALLIIREADLAVKPSTKSERRTRISWHASCCEPFRPSLLLPAGGLLPAALLLQEHRAHLLPFVVEVGARAHLTTRAERIIMDIAWIVKWFVSWRSPMDESYADLFKCFAHPSRLKLMELLARAGELSVMELAQALGVKHSTISKHLHLLRLQGLVRPRREGQLIYYSLNLETITQLFHRFLHSLEMERQATLPLFKG
jgi:DNA-binding transcriptional ArsR family regulator